MPNLYNQARSGPASFTIGIIINALRGAGVDVALGQFSRVGRYRGFVCAWFAAHEAAAHVAYILRPAATVKRDCGGGWFVVIRFHTFAQSWA